MNLKPGDLLLVKADAFKGKRKIKDRWEEETWEVVHQIATDIPSYEVTNQQLLVASELVFPCVWAAIMHGTGVTAPPHARSPLQEVKERGLHKRKIVRQSSNNLPVKLPWGGKMGSCNFCCGHLLEHPLRMGEVLG